MKNSMEKGDDIVRFGEEFSADVEKGLQKRDEIREKNNETIKEYNTQKTEEIKKEKHQNALEKIKKFETIDWKDLSYRDEIKDAKFYFRNKIAIFTHGISGYSSTLQIRAIKDGKPVGRNFDVDVAFRKKCDELKNWINPTAFSNIEKYPPYDIEFSDLKLNDNGELEINFDVLRSDTNEKLLSYNKTINPADL